MTRTRSSLGLALGLTLCAFLFSSSQRAHAAFQVQTSGAGLTSKVAPGEFLPISLKLMNFGSQDRVDVAIVYQLVSALGQEIYKTEETVAVQTTASFVKTIQIPFDTLPGRYTVKSSITYKDQLLPATTEFSFVVERKIFGVFQSEFYLYLGILLLASILVGFIVHAWAKSRRGRLAPIDYSGVPSAERMFYELISDTIANMRQHAGDAALEIAKNTEGLVIDDTNGKVLEIKDNPAKVMALLVQKYEQSLGQRVSFALRGLNGKKGGSGPALTDKKFTIINS